MVGNIYHQYGTERTVMLIVAAETEGGEPLFFLDVSAHCV